MVCFIQRHPLTVPAHHAGAPRNCPNLAMPGSQVKQPRFPAQNCRVEAADLASHSPISNKLVTAKLQDLPLNQPILTLPQECNKSTHKRHNPIIEPQHHRPPLSQRSTELSNLRSLQTDLLWAAGSPADSRRPGARGLRLRQRSCSLGAVDSLPLSCAISWRSRSLNT